MPRVWLLLIIALVIAPWLVVGGIYLRDSDRTAPEPPGRAGAPPPVLLESSRSGRLVLTPIVISPPLEYVPHARGKPDAVLWHVPVAAADDLPGFLSSAGLTGDQIAHLTSKASRHPQAGGWVLTPGADFVRGLAPEVRARLYLQLARSELNADQRTAYRFVGPSSEAWLGPPLEPRTVKLVEPLIYRHGDFMYFADLDLVRGEIADERELQLLTKRLLRQSTFLVTLRVDTPAEVPALAEYWGRGGRRTDIRPLLESVAGGGPGGIDIAHLLPAMPRELLYRYPRVSAADLERPLLANSLWTALNFFHPEPDSRHLDVRFALDRLKRDYYLVHDNFQLGDVVAFADSVGNIFHAAVYLADGLVFGKNGHSPFSPWSILPLERLKGHYVEHGDDWLVTYHRRKDL